MHSMTRTGRALAVMMSLAVATASAQPSAVPPLSDLELQRLVGLVQGWRFNIAPPGAIFDWCRISEAFDASGNLRLNDNPNLRVATRSVRECPAREQARKALEASGRERPRVPAGEVHAEVTAMRVFADSIVLSVSLRHPGVSVGEQYVLERRDKGRVLGMKLSRQTVVVYEH